MARWHCSTSETLSDLPPHFSNATRQNLGRKPGYEVTHVNYNLTICSHSYYQNAKSSPTCIFLVPQLTITHTTSSPQRCFSKQDITRSLHHAIIATSQYDRPMLHQSRYSNIHTCNRHDTSVATHGSHIGIC